MEDAQRYEPGPTEDYGASGLPREGMTERYATAMWRDDPSAFWLHPEGPLSETTPEEYFVPRPPVPEYLQGYAARGLLNSGAAMNAYLNAYGQNMLAQHVIDEQQLPA